MKKLALLVCMAMLASLSVLFVSAADINQTSTASYATKPPVIDGEIDEIWDTTAKQIIENDADGVDFTDAYTQILWDESGFYFLAYVEDPTLTENDENAANSVSFWVSETHTRANNYYTDPGDWAYTVSSDEYEVFFQGKEEEQQNRKFEVGILPLRLGYIIELYMPYLGNTAPAQGNQIGFNATVNDDVNNDGVRDGYAYWSRSDASAAYWSETLALNTITLVGPNGEGAEDSDDQPPQFAGLEAKKWSFDATLAEMTVIQPNTMLSEELFSDSWEGAKLLVTDASDPFVEINVASYMYMGGLGKLNASDANVIVFKCKTEEDFIDYQLYYRTSYMDWYSEENSMMVGDIWIDDQGFTYIMFDLTDMWEGQVYNLRFDLMRASEGDVLYMYEMVILDTVDEAYAYGNIVENETEEETTTSETSETEEESTTPEATETPEQTTESAKSEGCKSVTTAYAAVAVMLLLGVALTKKKD